MSETSAMMTVVGIGTLEYMAPELCANEVDISHKFAAVSLDSRGRQVALQSYFAFQQGHSHMEYGQCVDVYALGIILWEMLAHAPPWEGLTDKAAMLEHVASGGRPPVPSPIKSPPGWCELMRACWHQNPQCRPDSQSGFVKLCSLQAHSESVEEREISVVEQFSITVTV